MLCNLHPIVLDPDVLHYLPNQSFCFSCTYVLIRYVWGIDVNHDTCTFITVNNKSYFNLIKS